MEYDCSTPDYSFIRLNEDEKDVEIIESKETSFKVDKSTKLRNSLSKTYGNSFRLVSETKNLGVGLRAQDSRVWGLGAGPSAYATDPKYRGFVAG